MNNKLILAWRNPKDGLWLPVGLLQFRNNKYLFEYTLGAKHAKDFVPFGVMNKFDDSYESDELFPLFQNRLLPKSRPEHSAYFNWLDLKGDNVSSFEELAKSRGIRATDSLQLFPVPQNTNGTYEVTFFSHGIRHLPANYIERVNHLGPASKLYLMRDIQNEYDCLALALRTDNPIEIVGYCPRFFVKDFDRLIETNGQGKVKVSIVKVNLNSPLQFRLLCKFSSPWPEGFVPFEGQDFQPIHSS